MLSRSNARAAHSKASTRPGAAGSRSGRAPHGVPWPACGIAIGPEVHVEQSRLFGEVVLVHRGHFDAVGAKCVATALTSPSIITKSPVIAAVVATSRLEVDAVVTPCDGTSSWPISMMVSVRGTPYCTMLPLARPCSRGCCRASPCRAADRLGAGGGGGLAGESGVALADSASCRFVASSTGSPSALVVHVHHVRRHVVQVVVQRRDLESAVEQSPTSRRSLPGPRGPGRP